MLSRNRTYHKRGELVHGYRVRRHPLYATWANMLARCHNPAAEGYENYGGRGISVCPAWHHFVNFANDMHPKPYRSATIDRIDNNQGYSPDNCAWSSRSDQCVNRRTFKSNTTGRRGVVAIGETAVRFEARFDYEGVRYRIGRFDSVIEAAAARSEFVHLFFNDRPAALALVEQETVWCSSSTKVRGVSHHPDGGYLARATIGGVRHYIGYFKTVEEAANARTAFLACQAG